MKTAPAKLAPELILAGDRRARKHFSNCVQALGLHGSVPQRKSEGAVRKAETALV
jgi:hypothetical protein